MKWQPLGGMNIRWLAERIIEDRVEVRALPQLHKVIGGEERGDLAEVF